MTKITGSPDSNYYHFQQKMNYTSLTKEAANCFACNICLPNGTNNYRLFMCANMSKECILLYSLKYIVRTFFNRQGFFFQFLISLWFFGFHCTWPRRQISWKFLRLEGINKQILIYSAKYYLQRQSQCPMMFWYIGNKESCLNCSDAVNESDKIIAKHLYYIRLGVSHL